MSENAVVAEDAMTQAEEPLHAKLASLGLGHREVPLEVGDDPDTNSEEVEADFPPAAPNKTLGSCEMKLLLANWRNHRCCFV